MENKLAISGKVQKFDLTGENSRGRQYILCDINYKTLRTFFTVDVYKVQDQTGEQREATPKRVNYLSSVMTNEQYTPSVFTASLTSIDQAVFNKGRVTVNLSSDNKLPLLDGGHRMLAMEKLSRDSEQTKRKVENQPIPLMLLLDPDKRKGDFIALNQALGINKSHLLSMRMDQNLIDPKKAVYFKIARKLALHLHEWLESPFHKMITFGGSSIAPLSFSAIASDRKGDGITTLFYSAKLLEATERSEEWFYQQIKYVDSFIKNNTSCGAEGNLLCVSGARGCSNLLLGVINQWCYYLYLHNRDSVKPVDEKALKNALTIVFSEPVAGDLSSKRRKNLMRDFAQLLYKSIADDNESQIGCHFGIPIGLLILTSASSFGIENPPVPLAERKKRGRKPKEVLPEVDPLIEEVEQSKVLESDTDWD
jgi:hypothetical protein